MPVHYRAQVAISYDTLLPRDVMMINPCFRDSGATSDPDGLASDLANAVKTKIGATRQITVKMYDIEGTPPVFPAGQATVNAGLSAASVSPRELAICLSFFGGKNLRRRRGRLYLATNMIGASTFNNRPTSTQQSDVASWVPIFTGLGGADVDWIVWSQKDHLAHAVSDWWVDDEWDVVRSRGLRPVGRLTGTTTESFALRSNGERVELPAAPSPAAESEPPAEATNSSAAPSDIGQPAQ